ncbi:MAG: NADH-quinone oxidoreductase subunit N [Myxococcota bacterium]
MPIGHVAPGLAVVLGAVVGLLAMLLLPRGRQGWGAAWALGTLGVALGLAVDLHVRTPAQLTFHGTWALDGVTGWATFAILGATAVVVLLSPAWLRTDPRHGEWYTLLLLSALGALMLAGAADLLELMVGMLLVSVTGYTLASYHRGSRMSAEAGAKYFLLGALTNPLLFLGIALLYGLCATTRYAEVRSVLAGGGADPVALTVAAAFVLLGLFFELGAVPTHPWVPDVSQGSPAPAAAFLTVVPKIGALVAIARFVQLLPEEVPWRLLVAVVALLTMTLGNLAALWQQDVRRLLGWSSVSQAGYGLMAVVALGRSDLAVPSLVLFVVAYGLANVAAFGVVVALRGRTRLEDYRGLGRVRPWHAASLVLALLSLVGIPPLVGFGAKLALFGAAIQAGYGWLAVAAVINTVISLFYYLRVIAPMLRPAPEVEVALLGRLSPITAVVAALLTLVAGLAAHLPLQSAAAATLLPG